jgi:putative membrane protein
MGYIDILTSQLMVLGFAGLVLVSTTIRAAFLYKRGKKHYLSLKGGAIPLAALGLFAFVTGLYGQFTWPLPGAYNILYYDVFTLFGLLLLAFAWSVRSEMETQHVGLLGLLLGVFVIYYGYNAFVIGLSQAPIAVLGLYTLFGLSGILSYPMTIMLDRANAGMKNRWAGWILMAAAFIILLTLGSLLALYIAYAAIPAHLMSPP